MRQLLLELIRRVVASLRHSRAGDETRGITGVGSLRRSLKTHMSALGTYSQPYRPTDENGLTLILRCLAAALLWTGLSFSAAAVSN